MKLKDLLSQYDINLSLNILVLKAEITFKDSDKKAAWELYIELLTRVTTEPLSNEEGIEQVALSSVYSIFPITREILKKYGRRTIEFSKIAIPILNQKIRPFTTKWHKLGQNNNFNDSERSKEFRDELKLLQIELRKYNKFLAYIAGVEDLTFLEKENKKAEKCQE